jgi:uncharacterized protein (TIGR00251 family)
MVRLVIHVKPGASRDEIAIDTEENISIRVKAKPIEGEANDYLVKYLSKELDISRGRIQLEKGATSRVKRISIDITQPELDQLLKKYKKP